ncbi:MAG: hypothetical protein KAG43_02580 [Candidatus Marithrix sp.]|nr:hypothetical protein [Candidatus Marithrix sp.]
MRTTILIILLVITNSVIADTYGPTKTGDLLWNIAGKVRPNTSVTRYQAMLALLKNNPHAFRISCNLNTLKVGKILQIPVNMLELTGKEAINEFYRQIDEWKDFRNKDKPIICPSIAEQSPIRIPLTIEPILEPNIETRVKITAPEILEATIPSIISKQIKIPTPEVITDEIENLTLIQSIWNDIKIWFYSISYLHQIIFLALVTLFSISLLLLLFASIFRKPNKKEYLTEPKVSSPTTEPDDDDTGKLSEKNNKMKDKLDTVRAYLAEDEASRVQRLLREVIQNGTDEQRMEAQQLYEINKKMSFLKHTDTQAINRNIEQINKLIPAELSMTGDKEQAFTLIDNVFMTLDEELNAQGKLIDSYIARQQEATNPNMTTDYGNNYQVVEENSSKRPELKPTRKL